MERFSDLILGGVLISPFVSYAAVGMVIVLLVRPVLARMGFHTFFSAPQVAMLSLYISVVALLAVLS